MAESSVYCVRCLANKKRRSRGNKYDVETVRERGRTLYRLRCPDRQCRDHTNPRQITNQAYWQLMDLSARLFDKHKKEILLRKTRKGEKNVEKKYLENIGKDYVEDLIDSETKELKRLKEEERNKHIRKILGEKALEKAIRKRERVKELQYKATREKLKEEKVREHKIRCPYCHQYSLKQMIDPKTGDVFYRCINKNCLGQDADVLRQQLPNRTDEEVINSLKQALKDDAFRNNHLPGNTADDIKETLKIIEAQRKRISIQVAEESSYRRISGLGGVPLLRHISKRPFKAIGRRSRQAEAKSSVYERRVKELEEKHDKGEIGYEELQQKKREVEQDVYQGKRFKHIRTYERGISSYAPHIMEVIFALALGILGVIVSAFTGTWYFVGAFASVSMYLILPDPGIFKPSSDSIKVSFKKDRHTGLAFVKSIAKISAIVLFALAFKDLGDLFNIAFILTCFIGYYTLAINYENQAEFLESLLRFGVLGAYFIPFVVFGSIFNSYVLVFIALAFFAVPPMPKSSVNIADALSKGLSGATMWYDTYSKWIFAGLMFIALIGSGSIAFLLPKSLFLSSWALEGTLKATFIWFWIISAIAGFFSPAETRPVTGIIMLGGATVIYGVGPGSQEIGSALLGQWWPSVNEALVSITKPVADIFSQLSGTFGNAFTLLINPVGYATQILNGSYSTNPHGATGAFGVELENLRVSPIYVNQPYLITTKVKNVGSHTAGNVMINVQVGLEWGIDRSGGPRIKQMPSNFPRFGDADVAPNVFTIFYPTHNLLNIRNLGFDNQSCSTEELMNEDGNPGGSALDNNICIQKVSPVLEPQDIRQVVFTSKGIDPSVITNFKLRKKSIPIFTMLSYAYAADSSLTIEFISQNEWNRLAKEDSLVLHKEIPQVSTSPVQFPIGTMEQPILTESSEVTAEGVSIRGTPFYLGIKIESNEGDNSLIEQVFNITLEYPEEFGEPVNCVPYMPPAVTSGNNTLKLVWTQEDTQTLKAQGMQTIICNFNPLNEEKLEGSPTRTFLVEAHADFQFQRWETNLAKIEFGGFCADNSDCLRGQECIDGICLPKGTTSIPGTAKGQAGYCEWKKGQKEAGNESYLCAWGEGGCTNNNQCDRTITYDGDNDTLTEDTSLQCRSMSGLIVNVCCPPDQPEEACRQLHNEWLNGTWLPETEIEANRTV